MILLEKELGLWGKLINYYVEMGDYKKALKHLYKMCSEDKNKKDLLMMSHIYNHIGYVYLRQGDYHLALKFKMKGLSLRKEKEDLMYIGESYNDIGVVYHKMRLFDKAIAFYNKGIVFLEGEDLGVGYKNIGSSYYYLKEWDKSCTAYGKAKEVFTNSFDLSHLSEIDYNLGVIHYITRKLKEARDFFKKSLEGYSFLGRGLEQGLCQKVLGDIFFEGSEYGEASNYYNQCLKFLKKEQFKNYRDVEERLREIEKLG